MLVGEPPFTGDSVQAIIAKQLNQPVPPVTAFRAQVPVAVDGAIRRSLAKLPADRFQTASEFAAALAVSSVAPAVPMTSRGFAAHRKASGPVVTRDRRPFRRKAGSWVIASVL